MIFSYASKRGSVISQPGSRPLDVPPTHNFALKRLDGQHRTNPRSPQPTNRRQMQLASWTTGSDSIGWSSLPHDSRWCITPPPFGRQCTLLRPVAVLACLSMPRCVALTCPDPAESHIGRKAGVTGPICQARSVRMANEKHHGMCRPGGCLNVILRRRSRAGALREQSLATQGMHSDARASAWLAFAAFANASRAGMLLVQPRPPLWLAASLSSSSPLGKPPFETPRGTVFLVAGGIAPRAGDGRRIKQV